MVEKKVTPVKYRVDRPLHLQSALDVVTMSLVGKLLLSSPVCLSLHSLIGFCMHLMFHHPTCSGTNNLLRYTMYIFDLHFTYFPFRDHNDSYFIPQM